MISPRRPATYTAIKIFLLISKERKTRVGSFRMRQLLLIRNYSYEILRLCLLIVSFRTLWLKMVTPLTCFNLFWFSPMSLPWASKVEFRWKFESRCSYLNFRFRACFEQGVPWHSGNYRVWIHSETRTWHDKNIQSMTCMYCWVVCVVCVEHPIVFKKRN